MAAKSAFNNVTSLVLVSAAILIASALAIEDAEIPTHIQSARSNSSTSSPNTEASGTEGSNKLARLGKDMRALATDLDTDLFRC